MNVNYVRFEFARLFRNRQNFIFSLIFPVVLFFVIAGSSGPTTNISPKGEVPISFGRYYMAGMIAFGTMAAVFSGGARIAMERQIGWNRQLRLTPLASRTYLSTKILTSYLLAIISTLLVTAAALVLGVHLNAQDWVRGAGLTLVALIPFAAMGVLIGHLIKGDSIGPAIGGGISLFAIIGGSYFPIGGTHGVLHDIVRLVPSFWLVQSGKTGIGGQSWTVEAWLVIAAWTVLMGSAAAWAYRRDTSRA